MDEKQIVERKISDISCIEDMCNYLTCAKVPDSKKVLREALNTQIKVMQAVSSPELSNRPFDLIFEYLNLAVQNAESVEEKTSYQKHVTYLINTVVFFMEARLYWEKKKFTQEGKKILEQGVDVLVDAFKTVVEVAAILDEGEEINIAKLKKDVLDSLISSTGMFLKRCINWFFKKERVAQYQTEFYTLMVNLFKKLDKYKKLFGKQLLLEQLILNYSEKIAYYAGDTTKNLRLINPNNSALKIPKTPIVLVKCLRGVLWGASVIMSIFILFLFFNWVSGDGWLESLSGSVLFTFLFNLHFWFLSFNWFLKLLLFACLGVALRYGIKYNIINFKLKESKLTNDRFATIAEQYFIELSEIFSEV